jgi:hypothetical protein
MVWLKIANDPIQDEFDFDEIPLAIEWPVGSVRKYNGSWVG